MKQVIELTKEQIEILTRASKDKLASDMAKEIKDIEAKYEKMVKALENKFKTFAVSFTDDVEIDDPKLDFKKKLNAINQRLTKATDPARIAEIQAEKEQWYSANKVIYRKKK